MLPLILSILLPGLGQFYYGKNIRAILMLLLALTPLYPAALVWSVIDVLRLNNRGIEPRFQKKEATWAVVILLVIIPLCLFVSFSAMLSVASWYSNNYMRRKATIEEGHKIISAIQSHHSHAGKYPVDTLTIIKGIPVRAGWETDEWGESYVYEIVDDGQDFRLLSKGKDRILGTEDDIVLR
jgi:hypothetical protein